MAPGLRHHDRLERLHLNAVDLFGGAGGSHLGLLEAGYTPTSYDNWSIAVATQHANGHHAVLCDLSTDDPPMSIDPWLMWASPPCTPFSTASSGRGRDDPRDGIKWWLRILGRQLPEVSIMENVRGLSFPKHAGYLAKVLRQLHDLGYRRQWRLLNCADYGIPQTRERVIIIARRDDGPILWPPVTHTRHGGPITKEWVSWGRGKVLEYRQRSGRTGQLITSAVSGRPAPTIGTQSAKQWLLDGELVPLSELAALQGFPEDYHFCGNTDEQARQIGNAVPPLLARLLAEANRPQSLS